jgi:uncharacterized protein YggT (Ycf19 family)
MASAVAKREMALAKPRGRFIRRLRPTIGAKHLSLLLSLAVCIAANVLGGVMTRVRGATGRLTPFRYFGTVH